MSLFHGSRRGYRINRFPRSNLLSKKDSLARHVAEIRSRCGKSTLRVRIPETFLLPTEAAQWNASFKKTGGQRIRNRAACPTGMPFLNINSRCGDLCRPSKSGPENWKDVNAEFRGCQSCQGQRSSIGCHDLWIMKPAGSSQGKGIFLTDKFVPSICSNMQSRPFVASRYLSRPLLIDGHKFDLRIYVAVSGIDPLRIWVHEEGLVRFASEKFCLCQSKLNDTFVHLTNYSINKHHDKYREMNKEIDDSLSANSSSDNGSNDESISQDQSSSDNDDYNFRKNNNLRKPYAKKQNKAGGKREKKKNASADLKWTLKDLRTCFFLTFQSDEPWKQMWNTLTGEAVKAILGIYEQMASASQQLVRGGILSGGTNKRGSTAFNGGTSSNIQDITNGNFQLFGFDFLIDSNLDVWLIEVNLSPSLNCDALIDLKVKSKVISDLFHLIGMPTTKINPTPYPQLQAKSDHAYDAHVPPVITRQPLRSRVVTAVDKANNKIINEEENSSSAIDGWYILQQKEFVPGNISAPSNMCVRQKTTANRNERGSALKDKSNTSNSESSSKPIKNDRDCRVIELNNQYHLQTNQQHAQYANNYWNGMPNYYYPLEVKSTGSALNYNPHHAGEVQYYYQPDNVEGSKHEKNRFQEQMFESDLCPSLESYLSHSPAPPNSQRLCRTPSHLGHTTSSLLKKKKNLVSSSGSPISKINNKNSMNNQQISSSVLRVLHDNTQSNEIYSLSTGKPTLVQSKTPQRHKGTSSTTNVTHHLPQKDYDAKEENNLNQQDQINPLAYSKSTSRPTSSASRLKGASSSLLQDFYKIHQAAINADTVADLCLHVLGIDPAIFDTPAGRTALNELKRSSSMGDDAHGWELHFPKVMPELGSGVQFALHAPEGQREMLCAIAWSWVMIKYNLQEHNERYGQDETIKQEKYVDDQNDIEL